MPARKIVDIDMDAKKPYAKLGQVFHLGFLSLTCDSFRVLRVAATVSRTVAPTKQRIALEPNLSQELWKFLEVLVNQYSAVRLKVEQNQLVRIID